MSDIELAKENADLYMLARNAGHLDFIKKATLCDQYFVGVQWDPDIKAKLEGQGKPVLTLNKVLPSVGVAMGEQLQNQADIAFRPIRNGSAETAEALDKVWLNIANSNHLDWVESDVADDGFIMSRGFFDVRIAFDDHMRGEVRIVKKNPKNIIPDPDADSYDPDDWKEVWETKWLTLNDIELLYGKEFSKELSAKQKSDLIHGFDFIDIASDKFGKMIGAEFHEARPDERRRRVFRVIERQFKEVKRHPHFVDTITGDTRAIPDNWDRERIARVAQQAGNVSIIERNVERIRWRTSIDTLMLFDEWSPLKHFTVVPYFPYLRNGRTVGLVENLVSPQDLLNKSTSQELHIVNSTSNGGWQMEDGQLINMEPEELEQKGAMTGLVIVRKAGSVPLDKIQPNQVPTGLDRLSFKADEHMSEISGSSESLRGLDRADVSSKAIKAKQAAGVINFAKPLANLIRTRTLVAKRVLDLVQEYYTEERVLQIIGKGPRAETEELVINQRTPEGRVVNDLTIGEYDVVVSTVPARESQEDTVFEQAVALRELGVEIPDETIIESSRLPRKGEILEAIAERANSPAAQLANMEVQLKAAEIAGANATATKTKAEAALSLARAQTTTAEDGGELELEKFERQLELEQEQFLMKQDLERKQHEDKMALERQRLAQEEALKHEEIRMRSVVERVKAAQQAKIQQEKSRAQSSSASR